MRVHRLNSCKFGVSGLGWLGSSVSEPPEIRRPGGSLRSTPATLPENSGLLRLGITVLMLVGLPVSASAQFKDRVPEGAELGEALVQRIQIGMTITAVGGPCQNTVGYAPVPDEWPEQQVTIVDEEISPRVSVGYVQVEGMAKAMQVKIPTLAAGDEAKALVTFEVRRSPILPPEDTDDYVLPDLKTLPREVRGFLAPSPMIESRDRQIRELAKEITADQQRAWETVEAIYDWVRENIKYKNGPSKGALAALRDGDGDCEEMTSLFIALCRASDVPARTVWVPGHCYPEFYLADKEGNGHWFPCQAAGTRAFGEIPETRPILQKGDNIHPPYDRRTAKRYMSEDLRGSRTGGKPRVKFIRRMVPQ